MYRLRIIYLCVLLIAIINNILGQSDIACVFDTPGDSDDTCPENNRCLLRQGINVTDYVCDCAGLYYTGYNCLVRTFITSTVTSCYGSNCSTGSFESENYPNKYSERRSSKIFLVYVPGILRFDLSFDNIFEVELYKDDLYIGSGLNTPFYIAPGEIEEKDNSDGKAHFFHGYSQPDDFSVTSDTMYMYWSTDNSLAYDGFRVKWTSVAMDVKCPTIPHTIYLPDNSDRIPATWRIPEVDCGVGYDNLIVKSNYNLGDLLKIDTYTVKYDYEDIFGHSDSCSFELRVEDNTIPFIQGCPTSFTETLCNETFVNWTEPVVTDNSQEPVDVFFTINGRKDEDVAIGSNAIKYIYIDSSQNRAFCEFDIQLTYNCNNGTDSSDFPIWVVFVIAGAAVAILFLILAIFAYAKLQAVKAGHKADLSFNPEEYTGHKPGAPLEDTEALTTNGKEKVGMYEIQAYDNAAV